MLGRGRWGSRAGVTLVELLVVMLIVVILAVSLTPLFRDYITRAQYTAEAVPVVADLRTKTTLFQYDKGFLPGIPRATGKPVENPGDGFVSDWGGPGKSLLRADGGEIAVIPSQSFIAIDGSDPLRYQPSVIDEHSASLPEFTTLAVSDDDAGDHFSSDLNVDYEHFSGNRLRPNHVFYRTDHAGYKQGGHVFAIGVFGDGDGLAVGTGYAVMEIHNPTTQTKIVATWERWRAVGTDVGQITFKDSVEFAKTTPTTLLRRENVCWIGTLEDLMANTGDVDEDSATVAAALQDLAAAGWSF